MYIKQNASEEELECTWKVVCLTEIVQKEVEKLEKDLEQERQKKENSGRDEMMVKKKEMIHSLVQEVKSLHNKLETVNVGRPVQRNNGPHGYF